MNAQVLRLTPRVAAVGAGTPYNEFKYLWPPRPENKIPKGMLGLYQRRGYWAQVKKNGTCTVIFSKGRQVIFKTRHNDDHKLWTPLPEHIELFGRQTGWNVYVAELVHSKVSGGPKNQLYVFDQIVKSNMQLTHMTFAERQAMLHDDWNGSLEPHQVRVSEYVSIARSFDPKAMSFIDLWNTMGKEDEGLVLKNPNAKLNLCIRQDSNDGWQVKCRNSTKNYSC